MTGTLGVSGYRLYMDGGNDGNFRVIYDGLNQPGVTEFSVTEQEHGISPGKLYRFKASGLNYNGEGELSDEAAIYVCLAPDNFPAPVYVSSTETTLTVQWIPPREVYGCPISKYELFRDTGSDDAVSVQVGGDIEPHVSS